MLNIFRNGILVSVNVSYWSGAKMLTAEDLGLKDTDIANAFSLGRKMLIPRNIIRKFRAIDCKARLTVERNSFKFPIGNARFVPKRKFPKVLEKLEGCKEEYTNTVTSLIINYEKYRAEMIPIYKEAAEKAFDKQLPTTHEFSIESLETEKEKFIEEFLKRIDKFYPAPETLSSRFSLNWDVYEITLPRMRKVVAGEISEAEKKRQDAEDIYRQQAQEKIGSFLDEVVGAMRKETTDLCEHVIANIKSGKVIKDATIKSIHSFIDNFSELNFVGDEKIEAQLASLKKEFLNVHETKDISKKAELTTELSRRLHEIAEVAMNTTDINSVTGEYRRKINWQED